MSALEDWAADETDATPDKPTDEWPEWMNGRRYLGWIIAEHLYGIAFWAFLANTFGSEAPPEVRGLIIILLFPIMTLAQLYNSLISTNEPSMAPYRWRFVWLIIGGNFAVMFITFLLNWPLDDAVRIFGELKVGVAFFFLLAVFGVTHVVCCPDLGVLIVLHNRNTPRWLNWGMWGLRFPPGSWPFFAAVVAVVALFFAGFGILGLVALLQVAGETGLLGFLLGILALYAVSLFTFRRIRATSSEEA